VLRIPTRIIGVNGRSGSGSELLKSMEESKERSFEIASFGWEIHHDFFVFHVLCADGWIVFLMTQFWNIGMSELRAAWRFQVTASDS